MALIRGLFGATVVGGLLWAAPALAQTGTVTGRVVDSTTQQPLGGATIRLEGTQRGAQTREDGSYSLAAVPTGRQQLRISRIGFAAQLVPVTVNEGGNTAPTVRLRQLAATLAPVVSVGYGTQRAQAVTSAVSRINPDQANVGVQPNVTTLIQGRAAGVQITQNSGDPGAGAQIRVRGGSSITASDQPLYVIDGVPISNEATTASGLAPGAAVNDRGSDAAVARSPLNLLNPNDIAEITILKDASATAIYGSRGANGVVLITTKKGVAGTSNVEYNGFYSAGVAARKLDVLSGDQYRSFYQSQVTAGTKGFSTAGLAALGTANTNWQDAVFRTANIQNHNVAFSGGSQATQYRAAVNYFDNPGVVIGSGLSRVQGRLNGQSRLLGDRLTVNLNLTSSQNRDRFLVAENTGGFTGGVFINSLTFNPTRPVMVDANGQQAFYEIGAGAQNDRNPVGLATQLNDRATTNRTLGNLQGSYSFLPGLTASVNVGVDRTASTRGSYYPNANPLGASYGGAARLGQRNLQGATVQSLLTYDRSFTDQTLNLVGGYEYQRYQTQDIITAGQGFVTDATGVDAIGVANQVAQPFSNRTNRNLVSYFARANYGLKDRYFLTAVARTDGSSVFGANNKYATFPGVSASWRISQEPFFKANGVFSDLRLRGGFGLQGNQAINPYQTLALLGADPNSRYTFGGNLVTGVLPIQNPNPNLRWETTAQANVGLDFGVAGGKLTGTVEYYNKNTRDLLLLVPIPAPSVVSTQLQNIGKLRNAGFEGSLEGQLLNQPDRTLSLGLVLTADRNRVVSLGSLSRIYTGRGSGQGQSNTQSQLIVPGRPLGSFYGPVYAGVVSGVEQFNKYDANGNVTGTTTSPGDQDNQFLGNANPKFTAGFRGNGTFRRLDASFLVRGVSGNKVWNNTATVYASKSNASQGRNFLTSALEDQVAIVNANQFSSRFIEDGSFVRLQNVTVGYRLPLNNVVRRISSARVYVSGDNLLLGTHYSGYDPEVNVVADLNGVPSRGIDYLTYPRARTFTFGTSLGF